MGIEAIKNAGVAYQGSSSVASSKETLKTSAPLDNSAVTSHDTARAVENINIGSAEGNDPEIGRAHV